MVYCGSVVDIIKDIKDIKDESKLLRIMSILLVLCALLALGMIISTTMRINAYGSTPTVVSGKLDGVEGSYHSIDLHAGGNTYNLEKDARYSKRTYGVINDLALRPLMRALKMEVGKTMQLEYVQVAKKNAIVQLSIDGIEYVHKDKAVADFIGENKTLRTIGIISFSVFVILAILAWKGSVRLKNRTANDGPH